MIAKEELLRRADSLERRRRHLSDAARGTEELLCRDLAKALRASLTASPPSGEVVVKASEHRPHEWVNSPLGHGGSMCKHCKITALEATALGEMNHCPVASTVAENAPVPAPATGGEVELCRPYVRRNQPGHAMSGGEVVVTFRSDAEMELILDALRRDEGKGVREAALEEAAKAVEGWTVATNSRHLHGWGAHTNAVVDMLTKRDAEIAAALRALSASPAREEQVTDVEADRRERASKVKPDKHGHRTRFSDSSYFDEVCIMCGATDGFGDKRLDQPCPKPLPTTGGATK